MTEGLCLLLAVSVSHGDSVFVSNTLLSISSQQLDYLYVISVKICPQDLSLSVNAVACVPNLVDPCQAQWSRAQLLLLLLLMQLTVFYPVEL